MPGKHALDFGILIEHLFHHFIRQVFGIMHIPAADRLIE